MKGSFKMTESVRVINPEEERKVIDISALKENNRKLSCGLISPATEEVTDDITEDKTSEPIKRMEDIDRICKYLKDERRYRDHMLFVLGINFGLRVSDLRKLRFSNIINDNLVFKDRFPVFEQKTRNTRKKKINRYITVNEAVVEAVTLFLENTSGVSLSDYMFRSKSNNGKNENKPIDPRSVNRILQDIAVKLDLDMKISSHSLRKTFCYHQMLMSHNDPRKLMLLQKMLNHSSPAQTLAYIGITSEEIDEAYRNLNLGSVKYNYLSGCNIVEIKDAV